MRRHIPGLHSTQENQVRDLGGLFLVRVERASYRWHPQNPFLALEFAILEPSSFCARSFSGRIYCTERALWRLNWFLHDFRYDPDLLSRGQIDEKEMLNLPGVVRTAVTKLNRHSYQNLDAFAPAEDWVAFPSAPEVQAESEPSADDL